MSTESGSSPGPSHLRQRPNSRALDTVRNFAPHSSLEHDGAVEQIRQFMRSRSCYDILPESFRTIVLDNRLSIRSALHAMQINGVVSAPLYSSATAKFAGMLTLTDAIHLIQYYYQTQLNYDDAAEDVEGVQLSKLRELEEQIDVPPPPLVSIHPDQSLHDACAALVRTHARRIPVIDQDEETGKDIIVSVLTQYRVLKFIAINCYYNALQLTESIGDLGIGTYIASYGRGAPRPHPSKARARPRSRSVLRNSLSDARDLSDDATSESALGGVEEEVAAWAAPIAVATMETTVFDIVHIFSEQGISAVPIIDELGRVINCYETVDIVELVRDSAYSNLDLTIREAIARRRPDYPGVVTCTPEDSLAAVLDYVRTKRVHRMIIVEGGDSSDFSPLSSTNHGGDSARSSPASFVPGTPPRLSARLPGRLIGLLTLSDVLRYLIGTSRSEVRGYEVEGLGFRPIDPREAETLPPAIGSEQQ